MVLTSEQATKKIRQNTRIDAATLNFANEISDGKLDIYLPQCHEFIRDWLFDRLVTDDCIYEQEAVWELLLKTYKRSKLKPPWNNLASVFQRVLSSGPSALVLAYVCEFIQYLKNDHVSLRLKIEQSTQILKTYLHLCTQKTFSENCNDTFFSLYELSLFGNPNRKHCLALFEEQCLLPLLELLNHSELVSHIVRILSRTVFSLSQQKLSAKTLSSIPPSTLADFLRLTPQNLSSAYVNDILSLPMTSYTPQQIKQILNTVVDLKTRPPTKFLAPLADHSLKTKDWCTTSLLLEINDESVLSYHVELFASTVPLNLAILLFKFFLKRRQTPEFLISWSKASTSPWKDVNDELFGDKNLISYCAEYIEGQLSVKQLIELLRMLHGPPLYSLLLSIRQERYIEQGKEVLAQLYPDADAVAKFLILRLLPSLKAEKVQIGDLHDFWYANLFLRLHELEVCEFSFDRIFSDKTFKPRMLLRWPFVFEKLSTKSQKAEIAEVSIEKQEIVSSIFKNGQVLECRELLQAFLNAVATKMESKCEILKILPLANALLSVPANSISKGTRGRLIDCCVLLPHSMERFWLLDHLWSSPTVACRLITQANYVIKLLGEETENYSRIVSKMLQFLVQNITQHLTFFETLVDEVLRSDFSRAFARLASVLIECLPSDDSLTARVIAFVVQQSSKQLDVTENLQSLTWHFQALAKVSQEALLETDNQKLQRLLASHLSTGGIVQSHDSLLQNAFLILCKTNVEPLPILALYSVLVDGNICSEDELNEYSRDYWNIQSEHTKCVMLRETGSCRNPHFSHAAQRLVLRKIKRADEATEICSQVILDLCLSLSSLADERSVCDSFLTISMVLKTTPWMVDAIHVEALVAAITVLCSASSPQFHVRDVDSFFENIVSCVAILFLQQGHYLKRHIHLVSGMLQQMLHCFVLKQGSEGSRKPLWLGATRSCAAVSAKSYERLVSILCDPVSLQHGMETKMTLISAAARYRKAIAKHTPYLLLEILQLQLSAATANDVKSFFDGVVFSLFEVYDGGHLRMINSITNSSSRMYFKMLYELYTKEHKWKRN